LATFILQSRGNLGIVVKTPLFGVHGNVANILVYPNIFATDKVYTEIPFFFHKLYLALKKDGLFYPA
jgi:hypothetical protein